MVLAINAPELYFNLLVVCICVLKAGLMDVNVYTIEEIGSG